MSVAKSDPKRLKDLEAALGRAKPRDRLTLEECAVLWGVTKPRFVSVRNQMPAFPDPVDKEGNVFFYPARKALQAMLGYERRHDELAKARQSRADAILGKHRVSRTEGDDGSHSPNELATLSRIAADAEERERLQRLYVPIDEVVTIAGDVFGEVSDTLSQLAMLIDPHGRLDPKVRADIDKEAKGVLLRCHRRMKDILVVDVDDTRDRGPAGKARAARTRR